MRQTRSFIWLGIKLCFQKSSRRFFYFVVTTFCDYQTLGEEYTGIIQLNRSSQTIPSKLKRLVEITLHCFGFKIIQKTLGVNSENVFPTLKLFKIFHLNLQVVAKQVANSTLSTQEKNSVSKRIKSLSKILEFVEKINLVYFWHISITKWTFFNFGFISVTVLYWWSLLPHFKEAFRNPVWKINEKFSGWIFQSLWTNL